MEKSIRVLVIDDDEEDFMITRDLFKDIPGRHYIVDWASSYHEGIKEIRKLVHDIYLVDYCLGTQDENGVSIIRESLESGCKAPLLILSGQKSREIDEEAMKYGAHDFLVKGQVTARELESSIRYSINHAKNLEEIRILNSELEQRVEERTQGLHKAYEELEQSKTRTEQALKKEIELNELKSRFVTMASHEFRTPLAAILSSVDLVSKYASDTQLDNRKKHITRIRSSVYNLTEILEDFLSLGKLEEGGITASPVAFDLRALGQEVVQEMHLLLKKGQEIQYEYSGAPGVYLDQKIVRNSIINLLSNATKFSPEDKLINLSITNKGDSIIIKVRDHGIGIPPEEQKHLFGRFFRASNATNMQGTGLGLNIISRYAEILKGKISFVSEPGEGTTFELWFPLS